MTTKTWGFPSHFEDGQASSYLQRRKRTLCFGWTALARLFRQNSSSGILMDSDLVKLFPRTVKLDVLAQLKVIWTFSLFESLSFHLNFSGLEASCNCLPECNTLRLLILSEHSFQLFDVRIRLPVLASTHPLALISLDIQRISLFAPRNLCSTFQLLEPSTGICDPASESILPTRSA